MTSCDLGTSRVYNRFNAGYKERNKALFLNAVFAVFRSISLQHFGAAFCNDSLNDQNDPKNAAAKCCSQILQKLKIFEPPLGEVSAAFRCSISLQHFFRSPPLAHPQASTVALSPLTIIAHFSCNPHLSLSLLSAQVTHRTHTTSLTCPHCLFLSVMSRHYKTAAAMLLYQQLQLDDDEDFAVGNIIVPMLRRGTINSYYARRRRVRSRHIWSTLEATLTDRQFRMYFRMSKEIFKLLCGTIEDIIGRDSFKSEDFLNELLISDIFVVVS